MVRFHGAIPLSALLAVTKPHWITTVLNAGLWETDRTDGRDGKKARELYEGLRRTEASERDPEADKRLQYGNRAAIFSRAVHRQDWKTACVIAAETAVSAVRDLRMGQHRELATTYSIETDAIDINRAKTALIAGG
ncbi:hypothetical protein KC957_00255 [Candidatus Saccharibacteria bacterium]|nr:hypothetical protein [Candidatus Saccharibacteria bacterium]